MGAKLEAACMVLAGACKAAWGEAACMGEEGAWPEAACMGLAGTP